MELYDLEQEFNKIWNKADYKRKQQILREIDRIVNRRESEKNRIKAFFQAIQGENISSVKNILDQGIDVNEKDDLLGNTALSHAVFTRNIKIIKMLLDHGADPHVKNNRGYNAIDASKVMGNAEIIELLNLNK